MKRIVISLFIISLAIFLNSCEKIDDLKTISFSTSIKQSETIDLSQLAGELNIPEIGQTFDLKGNPDFDKYQSDRLKSMSINSITYVFSNYSGEDLAKFSGIMTLTGEKDYPSTLQEVTIKEVAANQTKMTVNLSDADKKALSTYMWNSKKLGFKFNGKINPAPVKFDVEFSINVSAEFELIK